MPISLSRLIHRIQPLVALAKCVAVLLSYLLGAYVSSYFHETSGLTGAILACTSAIVVLQETDMKNSLKKGWLRVLGTFIGAIIAYCYLLLYPFSIAGMVITTFILEIICMLLRIPDNGKMATITLIIILIVSKQSPDLAPWLNGVLRFSEAAIGAAIGIGLLWVQIIMQKAVKKTPSA